MMRTSLLTILVFAIATPAGADEIYKWTDEQGRTHYGSDPNSAENRNASKVDIEDRFATPRVPVKDPIPWERQKKSRTFSVAGLEMALPHSEFDQVRIGGSMCGRRVKDLYWEDGYVDLMDRNLGNAIARAADESGYIAENALQSPQAMDALVVRARLVDLEFNVCARSRENAHTSAWTRVEWNIQDPISGNQPATFTTEGSYQPQRQRPVKKSVNHALAESLNAATRNLLSQEAFVALMDPVNADQRPGFNDAIQVAMAYGSGNGSFQDRVDALKSTTVIVKTDQGHGSGVIVSSAGHILTNAHVLADQDRVTIKTPQASHEGVVVRSDRPRDVALIRVEDFTPSHYARISAGAPGTGSQLYLIGTPLDESFSQTITSGVLSAKREVGGADFYQTDASINVGNSGGPAFDESGELVGLTVAGHFSRSGANLNINYVIPISAALDRLALRPRGDQKELHSLVDQLGNESMQTALHGLLDWMSRTAFSF